MVKWFNQNLLHNAVIFFYLTELEVIIIANWKLEVGILKYYGNGNTVLFSITGLNISTASGDYDTIDGINL